MARIIGIRHRRKKTADGEARPTVVAIVCSDQVKTFELEDDTAELDFLMARFPSQWRSVEKDEDISAFQPRHCKWRKVKEEEDVSGLNPRHLRETKNVRDLVQTEVCAKVPVEFEGLKPDDKVAMVLGGSGDRFASALSRRGEEIGAEVYRIPPFSFAEFRGDKSKEDDHLLLVSLLKHSFDLFYLVRPRDRALIGVKEALMLRTDTMKARIGCEQRLQQRVVGSIFLNPEGRFPEGVIEDICDHAKANYAVLQALLKEEKERDKDLEGAVKAVDVWKIFEQVEGCGPRIAAGIIASVGDIRRFMVPVNYNGVAREDWAECKKRENRAISKSSAKLKAFCGVHVMIGGKYGDRESHEQFPRRRVGQVSNWSPLARQALYLLADQFNRRKDSAWNKKLLAYKQSLREKHPEPVEIEIKVKENGKKKTKKVKRYTKGHIHKMAEWRTLTKFVEWLCREWMKLEASHQGK